MNSLDDPNFPEQGEWKHPVDEIEPEEDGNNETKEAYKKFRFVMDRAVAHILDSEDPEVGAWQVAFALGSPNCLGFSMASKATELGLSKAAISKGATNFCRSADIEPSIYMLSKKAQESYRDLRQRQETERTKNNDT